MPSRGGILAPEERSSRYRVRAVEDVLPVFTAVLGSRGLRRELLTFLMFSSCEWAAWVAILVFAYNRGGASGAGKMAVVQLLPAIVVAPLGSVVADKLPRERALALGYGIQSFAMAICAVALRADAPIAVIYFCAALTNCSITLTRPVHFALLPEIAETPPQLTAANSASSILEGLAVMFGPLPAGLLLVHVGAWSVFAVCAATLLVACFIALRLHPFSGGSREKHEALLAGALEGFRELRREHAAALLTVLAGASFIVIGMLDVLTVVLALTILRMAQSGPSLMTSSLGLGALLGGAATTVLIGRRRLVPGLVAGIAVSGIPLALIAFAHLPWVAALLLVISGAGTAFFAMAGRTLLQRAVDGEVLARVFGLQEAMLMAGLAVGAALAPAFVRAFQPRGAFVVAGLLLPLMGLAAWPRLRRADASARIPGPELRLLRSIPLFQLLAPPGVEQLSWKMIPVGVPTGTVLMREGESGDRFYVVVEGEVEVTKGGRFVARVGPGAYVGEIALLRDVPRTATVTAVTDTRLLTLEREDFLAAVTGSRRSAAAAHSEIDRRLAEIDSLDDED
jgi:MFS family permease